MTGWDRELESEDAPWSHHIARITYVPLYIYTIFTYQLHLESSLKYQIKAIVTK